MMTNKCSCLPMFNYKQNLHPQQLKYKMLFKKIKIANAIAKQTKPCKLKHVIVSQIILIN